MPQFVTVVDGRLFIPKFKNGIKINLHREIQGEISHCTISKTATGKYFVSILCETEYQPKSKTNKMCGIDLGLKTFVVTSDNIKFKNNNAGFTIIELIVVIAIIAAVFGFGGIAAGAAGIAKILFIVFLIGAIVMFLMNGRGRI